MEASTSHLQNEALEQEVQLLNQKLEEGKLWRSVGVTLGRSETLTIDNAGPETADPGCQRAAG